MRTLLQFLKDRLTEGSTWVGISILTALGLSGEVSEATVDLVIAALSLLLAIKPDKKTTTDANAGSTN